jgi:hypothetical protein
METPKKRIASRLKRIASRFHFKEISASTMAVIDFTTTLVSAAFAGFAFAYVINYSYLRVAFAIMTVIFTALAIIGAVSIAKHYSLEAEIRLREAENRFRKAELDLLTLTLRLVKQASSSRETDPHLMKSDSHLMKSDPHLMKSDPHLMKSDPHLMTSDPHLMKSTPCPMRQTPDSMRQHLCVTS